MSLRTAVVAVVLASMLSRVAGAVILGQRDSFETPGVAGWSVGNPEHPSPPQWVPNGGVTGTYDSYLRVQGAGGVADPGEREPGSKPNVFNASQWAGDYLAAGVTGIELYVRYLGQGPETMELRIGLEGPAGFAWSLETQEVAPGTPQPWERTLFRIDPANLGGSDPLAVLGNVEKLWLYHAPVGATTSDSPKLDVRIGYDNIRAVPEPGTLALLGSACLVLLVWGWRRRRSA